MYILQKKDKPRTAVQSIGPQTKFMYNQYIRSKNVKWVQDQDNIQTGVRKTIYRQEQPL